MTAPESQQPELDEETRAALARAGQLLGRDPATLDVLDLIDAVVEASDSNTLPRSDGSVPGPAHVEQAADYPRCPQGADPARWASFEPYRAGWIDMVETGRAYAPRAGEVEYRSGMIAAAKFLRDGTADQPR